MAGNRGLLVGSDLAARWPWTSAFGSQIGRVDPSGTKREPKSAAGEQTEAKTHTTSSSERYDAGLAPDSAVAVSLCLLGCRAVKWREWVCDCASGAMQIAPLTGKPGRLGETLRVALCPFIKREKPQNFTEEMFPLFCCQMTLLCISVALGQLICAQF